jgi:hypothetical protein
MIISYPFTSIFFQLSAISLIPLIRGWILCLPIFTPYFSLKPSSLPPSSAPHRASYTSPPIPTFASPYPDFPSLQQSPSVCRDSHLLLNVPANPSPQKQTLSAQTPPKDNLHPLQLHNRPVLTAATSNTSPPHIPVPNPSPAALKYFPNAVFRNYPLQFCRQQIQFFG